MNLFSFVYPHIELGTEKPIKLFEAFSGIGCQLMALKRITDNYEIVGISEIDKYAIKSYEAIHGKVKNYGAIGSFERLPKNIDICTWSFPCQDISIMGTQKGMKKGTQSNYGYDFLKTVVNTPPTKDQGY
ncbi:MAG: DNA cytosine methyltransferase [Bacilli bacterium]|nr:DNA cytosine methyltransferase [Bacilli bacterium]